MPCDYLHLITAIAQHLPRNTLLAVRVFGASDD